MGVPPVARSAPAAPDILEMLLAQAVPGRVLLIQECIAKDASIAAAML
jgi:hypothetical protein